VGTAHLQPRTVATAGHEHCPLVATISAHRLVVSSRDHPGPSISAQSNHPCPRNGLAESNRFPTGLDQMSMMKEPINRRRSHGLGHQLVESRRMEIRRNRDDTRIGPRYSQI